MNGAAAGGGRLYLLPISSLPLRSSSSAHCRSRALGCGRHGSKLSSSSSSNSNCIGISCRRQWAVVQARGSSADVKSESLDVVPDSIKLKEALVSAEGEEEEGFPKRWVIVILCFSAFLLCNMDRVRNFKRFVRSL